MRFYDRVKNLAKKTWNASNSDNAKKYWNVALKGANQAIKSKYGQSALKMLDTAGLGNVARQTASRVKEFGDDVVNRQDDVGFQQFAKDQAVKSGFVNQQQADMAQQAFNKVAPALDKGITKFEDKVRKDIASAKEKRRKKSPRGVRRNK